MRTKPASAHFGLATAGLMLATALQAADAVIVNVALPDLQRDLGGGLEFGSWVLTSYLCATAVTAPLTGWLRRRYGARRLFPGAILGFIAASLLCALAPSGPLLILARVLQGAASGVILPMVQGILLEIYPPERHGRILGMVGAFYMLGAIVGPLLGGIVTDLASWRAAFAITIPAGIIVIVATRNLRYQEQTEARAPIDMIGIMQLIVGVAALEYTLRSGVGRSWADSPELIAGAVAAIFAFAALGLRARASDSAVLRPAVFKDVNFALAAFYNFMTSGLVFVTIVFLPILSQGPLGYSATLAGFTIVPRAILLMLMLLIVGELVSRVDHRILLSAGWLLMGTGLAILSQMQPTDGLTWMLVGSTVQALGAGLLFTPHSTLAFRTLAPELRTEAAGLFSLLRQLGYAFGVALMTALLQARIAAYSSESSMAHLAGESTVSDVFDYATLDAYTDCFWIMAVAAIAMLPGIPLFRVSLRKRG